MAAPAGTSATSTSRRNRMCGPRLCASSTPSPRSVLPGPRWGSSARRFPTVRFVPPSPLEPQGRCPRSQGRLDRKVVMPPVVRPLPPPRTARSLPPVARPPRSQGRPAPDREVTDRDGRSFSGEPWGRLLSSRSEPPTGAVLLELWGHAVQHVRARDPQRLATRRMVFPLCDRCTVAHGSALQCDCYGYSYRRA